MVVKQRPWLILLAAVAFGSQAGLGQKAPAAPAPPASTNSTVSVGSYTPTTLSCENPLTLTLPPGQVDGAPNPKIMIGDSERTADPPKPALLTIPITVDTDCGKPLKIASSGKVENFQIAAAPKKPEPPPALPILIQCVLFATALISFVVLVFVVLVWWRQSDSIASIKKLPATLSTMVDGPSKNRTESDPYSKIDKGAVSRIESMVAKIETKADAIGTRVEVVYSTVADLRSNFESQSSGEPSLSYESAPSSKAFTAIPIRSESPRPVLQRFEDAYNAAVGAPGHQLIYSKLDHSVLVNIRDRPGGDKNQSVAEPLVNDSSGVLCVFFVHELAANEAYLAPALDVLANGIGGTQIRAWTSLFKFPPTARSVSRLDKAAKVKRTSEGYEIVTPGEMS